MEKNNSLLFILRGLKDETLVAVWNEYCTDNCNERWLIRKNDDDTITECFNSVVDFARRLYNNSHYDYEDKWLVYGSQEITSFSDPLCYESPVDEDILIDWLVTKGWCESNDFEPSLRQDFIDEYIYSEDTPGEWAIDSDKLHALIEIEGEREVSYLKEDWDEIDHEVLMRINEVK